MSGRPERSATPPERYSAEAPCPVCGGYTRLPRGKGERCYGFFSADRKYAHCTRPETAGRLAKNDASGTYAHRLAGRCACGGAHAVSGGDPGPSARKGTPSEGPLPPAQVVYSAVIAGRTVQHLRKDSVDGKQMWWATDGKKGLVGTKVADLPLEGLEALSSVAAGSEVVVTEGEKASRWLREHGILAVGTVTGAHGTPADAVLAPLLSFRVILWPDNDEVGNAHMQRIGDALIRLGHLDVARVAWEQAPPKGDAADWRGDDSSLRSLLAAATPWPSAIEVLPPPSQESEGSFQRFSAEPEGLYWHSRTQRGIATTQLTNFIAEIIEYRVIDDGAEHTHRYTIRACVGGTWRTVQVPASEFPSMGWVAQLGPKAILSAGASTRDRTREAIQTLSTAIEERRVYAHLGWVETPGGWAYLHAAGAVSVAGDHAGVTVMPPYGLDLFQLPAPPPGVQLHSAIKDVLALLEIAPATITVPLFAAVWRAVLGAPDFGIVLVGATGIGKSELAALFQSFFGARLDARHLPGSWSSTANALEALAFHAKDTLLVVDDFAPKGTAQDVQRLNQVADRLFRGQGNGSGRMRLTATSELRPIKPPRALIVATAEDLPQGESLRARTLTLEMERSHLDWDLLTRLQRLAAEGRFAEVLAAFAQWLAPQYGQLRNALDKERAELRSALAESKAHRRTPSLLADLALGLRYFLRFTSEVEALTDAEAGRLWNDGWEALASAGNRQAASQSSEEPTGRFLALLRAALLSGAAHLTTLSGQQPDLPGGAGGSTVPGGGPRPQGSMIGWVKDEDVFLVPDLAFAAVQQLARAQGEGFGISQPTMWRRLSERGLLASRDGNRNRFTIRISIAGQRAAVLHLSIHTVFGIANDASQVSQPSQ